MFHSRNQMNTNSRPHTKVKENQISNNKPVKKHDRSNKNCWCDFICPYIGFFSFSLFIRHVYAIMRCNMNMFNDCCGKPIPHIKDSRYTNTHTFTVFNPICRKIRRNYIWYAGKLYWTERICFFFWNWKLWPIRNGQ